MQQIDEMNAAHSAIESHGPDTFWVYIPVLNGVNAYDGDPSHGRREIAAEGDESNPEAMEFIATAFNNWPAIKAQIVTLENEIKSLRAEVENDG